MTSKDRSPFRNIMLALAEAHDREIGAPKLEVYYSALRDLSIDLVVRAIEQSIREDKYWPAPGRIRELAVGAPHISVEDEAICAWNRLRCLKGSKAYNPEAFSDPIIKQVFLAMGGARSFGVWDFHKEERWKQKEFIETYSALRRHEAQPAALDQAASREVLKQLDVKVIKSGPQDGLSKAL